MPLCCRKIVQSDGELATLSSATKKLSYRVDSHRKTRACEDGIEWIGFAADYLHMGLPVSVDSGWLGPADRIGIVAAIYVTQGLLCLSECTSGELSIDCGGDARL